ncbi:MAG: helix-turn-helix domain-containing protein [Caulobacter sp.]|nr:helix-turn-helix domain-containing protein [Caulobacter sp.]
MYQAKSPSAPAALLTTRDAAEFLGVSPRTLEDWRLRGGGPLFCKVGARLVRYLVEDLVLFVEAGSRTNTGGAVPGATDIASKS